MKSAFLLLVSAAPLLSQPTFTAIDDIVYTPVRNVLFTGTLQVSMPIPLVATDGSSVAQWWQTIQVYGGVVKLNVIPNDAFTTPGTVYSFRFNPSNGGAPWEKRCTIPTSVSPVKLSAVCDGTPYSPPPGIAAGGQLSGYWPSITCPTCMVRGNNLSDVSSAPAARTNLGLAPIAATGSASDLSVGTVPLGRIPSLPESQTTGLVSDLSLKAPLASPDFTGDTTASGILQVGDPRKIVPFMNAMAGTPRMTFLATGGEFVGTGLNDLNLGIVTSGYTGAAPAVFLIKALAGTPDQFQWAKGSGAFSSPINVTGGVQAVSEGLTIQFGATSGHTTGDEWLIPTAAGMLWSPTLSEIGLNGATAALGSGAGSVTNGVHRVRYSWATGQGDTYPSNAGSVTVSDNTVNGKISITGIPQSTSALFIGTNVWVSKAGGSQLYLAAFLPAGTTSYTFNAADSALVNAAPSYIENLPTAGGCIYGELAGYGWGSCALQVFDYGVRFPVGSYYFDKFPNGLLGTSENFLTQYSTTGSGTAVALSNSPALIGTPTAPTASPGTNTTQVASTAFVAAGLALKQNSLGFTPENVANKNATNGYIGADGNAQVSQAQMPRCVQTVTFSSTPAFDFSLCPNQKITLTGNVSPTISNAAYCERGCSITFLQGVGSYTVTWPGSVVGGFSPGTTNGGANSQTFTSIDGSTLVATSYGAIQ